MKILVVDDSDLIRERFKKYLSELNPEFEIFVAEDVASGISEYSRIKPDLVILDIKMPGGSGFDILSHIRNENNRNAMVLMVSNYSSSEYKLKSKELGADYFFDKSVEFKNIFETVKIIQSRKFR